MNTSNYQRNDEFLDSEQIKGSWVSWTLVTLLRSYRLLYFRSFFRVLVSDKHPKILTKWRISVTFYGILITVWENHWLLRITWSFFKSVSEYESVFRICVWIMIHEKFSSLLNKSLLLFNKFEIILILL